MSFKQATTSARVFLSNHSPAILTGMGIVGSVSTAIMASQATLKAQDILYECHAEDADWRDKVALTWKCYIPTALMGASSIGCIVGSHLCSENQKTAIQSAYLLSQATLQEYQKKVVERIGERKEKEVYSETMQAVANNQSPAVLYSSGDIPDRVYETGHGNSLFYDIPGERYFRSDINFVKAQVNQMNEEVLGGEMYYDWNEIYYRWGLPMKKHGTEMIFDTTRLLRVSITPEVMDNGQVRLLLDYDLYPKSTFNIRG